MNFLVVGCPVNPIFGEIVITRIAGAIMIGVICGAIPLKVAKDFGRPRLGWIGFALSVVGGYCFGIMAALPVGGLAGIAIAIVGPPARKSRKGSGAPRIRTPSRDPNDF